MCGCFVWFDECEIVGVVELVVDVGWCIECDVVIGGV